MDTTRLYRTLDRIDGLRIQVSLFHLDPDLVEPAAASLAGRTAVDAAGTGLDPPIGAATPRASTSAPRASSPQRAGANLASDRRAAARIGRRLCGRIEVGWQDKVENMNAASGTQTTASARSQTLAGLRAATALRKAEPKRAASSAKVDIRDESISLFTLTDADMHAEADALARALTFGPRATTSDAAKAIAGLDSNGLAVEREGLAVTSEAPVSDPDPSSDPPDTTFTSGAKWRRARHEGAAGEMHIVASIPIRTAISGASRPLAAAASNVEKRLMSLRYYSNGVLAVTPDFLTEHMPMYRFSIGSDLYEVAIVNVSGSMTAEEEEKEKAIFQEFHLQNALAGLSLFSRPFEEFTQVARARVFVRGEICDGRGFDGQWVYLEYLVEPAEHCRGDTHARTAGTSQIAQVSASGQTTFALPLEAALDCPADADVCAHLMIKVCSVDSWDRHVVQGYLHVAVPATTGTHEMELETWRPVAEPRSKLMSFFLGGSPEIQDLSYLKAAPPGKPHCMLQRWVDAICQIPNRYGFKTETSGHLSLRFSVARQHGLARVETAEFGDHKDRAGLSDVLLRAKARLAALRQAGHTAPAQTE
ncbi:Pleiotropic negative transcriptional regulator [Polyrhizophydium stewartii]|uniref:Pleiotropic negative transcriptional regulator n=1 Tax=Polyrhizophydium stewartii TaxID=2732419 RepID=A0ABR4NDV4_9FUNG